MNAWPAEILNQWFVAATSKALRKSPLQVKVLATTVVLCRLQDGTVLALEDRCPHRQVPLSAGRATGAGIECPYHGWTFGKDGICTQLPGLPNGATASPRTPSYAVLERDGLIWINLANGSTIGTLPKLVEELQPSHRRFLWQTLWHAPIVDCLENFLDAMHTHYVHRGLVRKNSRRHSVTAMLTANDAGFAIDYRGVNQQSGLLYRLFESTRTSERALFASPGVAQIEYMYANKSTIRITLYFSPRDTVTTHVFATLHVTGRRAPAWAVRLVVWPFLRRVASQDARMLKLQSANRESFPWRRFVSTPNDLVRPYLDQVWTTASTDVKKSVTVELLI